MHSTRARSGEAPRLGRISAARVGLLLLCLTLLPAGCQSDEVSSDRCRLDPESCPGGSGALCRRDSDCIGGLFCCRDNDNCGGGMCTLDCRDDRDCPADMACEHAACFYLCDSDRDCAEGMSCEHGKTICEWR